MSFLRFFFSKSFVLNLLIAIALLAGGFYYFSHFLKDYTRAEQRLVVPDLSEMEIETVPAYLSKNNFRFELLDSIFDRRRKGGIVVEQKPRAGEFVKENRKIYVTINARSSRKIIMNTNNILHVTPRAAIDNLQSRDVVIDSIEYKDFHIPNYVLAIKNYRGHEIKNNEEVPAGAKLILVVSKTGEENVQVPKLEGMSLKEAGAELLANNLNYSVTAHKYHQCGDVIDSSKAFVKNQVPAAYEEIKTGSSVSLFFDCDTSKTN